jgi:uncharacterized membrane-anchored protein
MLVPANKGVLEPTSWVFTISFDEMGFVKDDDAKDIDYQQLFKDQRAEFKELNPERIKQGYDPIEFVGWASVPFYDSEHKILHWAKELKFGETEANTLNYNLRILGRKGIYLVNAIASMTEKPEVEQHLDEVLGSIQFDDGYCYADYTPGVDEIAAWTVGGLVAGKVLSKVGFFAFLAKFWKVGLLGLVGIGAFLRRFWGSKTAA